MTTCMRFVSDSEPNKNVKLQEDENAYLCPVKDTPDSEKGFVDEYNYLNLTYSGEMSPQEAEHSNATTDVTNTSKQE